MALPRFRLSKKPPGEEPRRVPSSADGGRKGSSVISGDMRVGNDTSHDGQGDFSARIEPCPSCIPLSKKAKGLFRQAEGTIFSFCWIWCLFIYFLFFLPLLADGTFHVLGPLENVNQGDEWLLSSGKPYMKNQRSAAN